MSEREIQVYTFTLNIQSIKMKVKFPCKMKLQYAGEVLTSEVGQNQTGKFIFNQEVTLKQDTDRSHFEIIANIATEKGAKYIAGVIRLAQNQLVNQQGQMIVVNLSKCLDPQACCELRVDQVSSEKIVKKIPIQKVMALRNKQTRQQLSPKHYLSPSFQMQKNHSGSKSQFQFPLNNNRQINQLRTRQQGHQSIYEQPRSPLNNFKKTTFAATYIEKNLPQFGFIDTNNRDKLIEAEVYKQSYQKLKQKYKKQAEAAKQQLNKRIALQNNENNFKLEIMRLKLRCQQQQKTITDKNTKLKQLQIQLVSLQKKQLDLSYLRQQSSNKQHTIRMLEDTIRTLNKDNEDLKSLNRERFETQQQKIRQMKNQLDSTKQKYQFRIAELQKQLKFKLDIISQKESEMRLKDERIQREQRLIDELEKSIQAKSYQHQRTVINLQNQWKIKIQQYKNVIERYQKQNAKLQEQIQNSRSQQQKIKSYIIKIEYDKKILSQQSEGFKTQMVQIKNLRQKYQQLARQHRLLTQDKNHLQKQYEKSLQSKDSNIAQISRQYKQQLDHYRRIHKQIEQKFKNSQTKIIQLQSLYEQKKSQAEKMRKNVELLSKQNNDAKQKQKTIRKTLKQRQQELSALNAQIQSNRYKSKNGDQLSRFQIQSLRDQIGKFRRDLQSQIAKSVQLSQRNSNLNNQLNKSKLQLQNVIDQNEKQQTIAKDKINSLDSQNREYEKRIDQLNSQISSLRNNDKENQTKIQKFQIQSIKTSQRIEKMQKQMKGLQQKVNQSQNTIRIKQNQVSNLTTTKENLQRKSLQLQQKIGSTKNNLNTIISEKNKNQKIIELLNRQINDLKQEADRQNKNNQNRQKQQQELRNEFKKSKQQYLKLQMKNSAMKKQYDRFKQQLAQTLSTTFAQIPLGAADMKNSSLTMQMGRKTNESQNSNFIAQIIYKITSQNKDVKVAMTKLIEHNKMLQKQIQRLTEDGVTVSARNQLNQSGLNKRIQELESQVQKLYAERQQFNIKNKGIIEQLENDILDGQNAIKQYMLQIQQLNFTVNSLKMDQQATSEHFNLKQNQYKSKVVELEQRISYITSSLNQSELNTQNLESKLKERESQLQGEKDTNNKKQKQIQTLREQNRGILIIIEDNKRQRKQLLEKISQLQLKLSTQIQLKQKVKSLLDDQERKGVELKQFVANLMKQKQTAIKSDLQKSQMIINLQASLLQSIRQKQMQLQQIQRLKKQLDEHKQLARRLSAQVKDLQTSGTDQKGRVYKITEKLKQKQRQHKQSEQMLSKVRTQLDKLTAKSNKTIQQLQNQLQTNIKQRDNQIKNLNQKIQDVQRERQENQNKLITLKSQIVVLEENLFMQKQSVQVKNEQSSRINEQLQRLRIHMKQLQQTINNQNQEIKDKQQGMFQLSGKVYSLENQILGKQKQANEKITSIMQDWSSKYDNMIDEYEQRIQLVEKQKNYFKIRLDQKEEEYRKLVAEIRNNQLEDTGLKKALQEKIKRLQQQRLSIISLKNAQIQRLAQDNKSKFELIKAKQADLRRLQHELEVARSTISKLEQSKRQTEQKIKHINKVYQSQLQQLRRRQTLNRNNTQQIQKIQWDIERQVKKTIQTYTKKIGSNDLRGQILSTIKGLEDQVINAVNHKFNPSN